MARTVRARLGYALIAILIGLAILMAVSSLHGCAPADLPDTQQVAINSDKSGVGVGVVKRFVDEEAGVVCWIANQNAISCLPKSQTELH